MNTTSNFEQTHSFWIIIWNFLSRFISILDHKEVQKAVTSINAPDRHPFWDKLQEALWTLVKIPERPESTRFHSLGHFRAIDTETFLSTSPITMPDGLRAELTKKQAESFASTNHYVATYSSEDLRIRGDIARLFPSDIDSPFDWTAGDLHVVDTIPLTRVMQFVDHLHTQNGVVADDGSENIFLIAGSKRKILISIRKKLGTWRMREVRSGDTFRGLTVNVFW